MTLHLLEGYDRQVRDFVTAHAPEGCCLFTDGDRGFAVVREDGRLVAGVVFSGWQPAFSSVELSAVALSSHALSPGIVRQLGDYAFRQLLANRVWARTSIKNHRATKLLRHVGFTAEGINADFYGPGKHAGMYRMLRREWEQRYGLKEAA